MWSKDILLELLLPRDQQATRWSSEAADDPKKWRLAGKINFGGLCNSHNLKK